MKGSRNMAWTCDIEADFTYLRAVRGRFKTYLTLYRYIHTVVIACYI